MARQAPGHRMDAEANLLAGRTQLAHQIADRILRLRHGHAVAGHDDHAVGVVERAGHPAGVDGDLLALDLGRRPLRSTEAAQDDADEVAVHRLAHDVGENRPGRANQRAGHYQQVIGEREADRRGSPARVAVEHGNHHRHVGTADAHDQVPADEERQRRQQQQRPEPGAVEVSDGQQQTQRYRSGIQQVPAGQLVRLATDLACQLAERHHGAGEGDRADEDTQHHLTLQEGEFRRGLVGQRRGKRRQAIERDAGRLDRHDSRALQFGIPADEDRSQADEAVQRRYQLGHFGHLDLARQPHADQPADQHHRDHPAIAADLRAQRGEDHGNRHADDAVPDRTLGFLLVAQSPQREDEQDTRRDRRGGNELVLQHIDSPRIRISGTWRACGGSPGSRRRC